MVNSRLPKIAITAGEPAGIGPDICALLHPQVFKAELTIIADQSMLEDRARLLGITSCDQQAIQLIHVPAASKVMAGKLEVANSLYVLETLRVATQGCLSGEFDAMVTAPVHKGVINDAGIHFTGHTEFLAEQTNTKHVVMMLVGGGMRVALATIHIPLKSVSDAITQDSLTTVIRILHHDLVMRFGISRPHILVAGLNPHAGEGGYLGTEEITTISPVLESLRREGMDLVGPLPADTLFTPHHLAGSDCVLAMYHDQGLTVLKHASFGGGVNVTMGLPIIRTSVDHGTALDLAGTGNIDCGSMHAAIELAIELANRKIQTAH